MLLPRAAAPLCTSPLSLSILGVRIPIRTGQERLAALRATLDDLVNRASTLRDVCVDACR